MIKKELLSIRRMDDFIQYIAQEYESLEVKESLTDDGVILLAVREKDSTNEPIYTLMSKDELELFKKMIVEAIEKGE